MQKFSFPDLKALLPLLKSKHWNDAVRLLDQFEVTGGAPGASCTMQVMNYDTGEWVTCEIKGRDTYSLAHWYKVIRGELNWDGAIRLAIAAT